MPARKILHLITAIVFFFLSISPIPGFAFDVSVTQGNATVSDLTPQAVQPSSRVS